MSLEELDRLISGGESLHLELKEWPVPLDRLAAALVAFANTDGGDLVLGVADDGAILGLDDLDQVARTVDNVATNNCRPPITVLQETMADKVLRVRVAKGEMRPYSTNKGVYYVRTSSGRRQASREELLRLFQASESLFYDETGLGAATIADLDSGAISDLVSTIGADADDIQNEVLLRNWRLSRAGHPTVAGMLFLGKEPQRFLPHSGIVAAAFPGGDVADDPMDRKELRGRIPDLLQQAERFLDLHLTTRHEIRGFEAERKAEIPVVALREAVVNALAHRDYTVQGPVRIFVLLDRVEIHTPGRPANTVDEAAMRYGIHVVRNPAIYSRLADAGMVTGAGTGVRRMSRLVREAIGRDIEIRIRDAEVVFLIPRPQKDVTPAR